MFTRKYNGIVAALALLMVTAAASPASARAVAGDCGGGVDVNTVFDGKWYCSVSAYDNNGDLINPPGFVESVYLTDAQSQNAAITCHWFACQLVSINPVWKEAGCTLSGCLAPLSTLF